MQNYQFQPLPSQPGEQVYQVSDRGGVLSELRTRPEAIVAGGGGLGAQSVELELARPGSQRYLPPRGPFIHVSQTPGSVTPASAPAAAPNTGVFSSAASSASAAVSGYFSNGRFATPHEEGQANEMRWPD
jgi:hypothetical protein